MAAIWNRLLFGFTIGLTLPLLVASAAEDLPSQPPALPSPAEPAAEVDRWIEQLNADHFAERQEASRKLTEIGPAAIDALAQAAVGESLEVTIRSIELLTKYLDSRDETVRKAAREGLQRIADSDRIGASRRAQDVLTPPKPPELQNPLGQIRQGAIQIAVAANAGANRIRVRNVNGAMTVEVEEPGQKIKIMENPQQGIQLEITKQKAGQPVTEKYTAKDAADLKKKHPEAHKLYEKYTKAGGNIRMQVPAGARPPDAPRRATPLGVETATRLLPAWSRQLERITSDETIEQAPREAQEQLRAKVAEAKQQLSDLESRLDRALKASGEAQTPAGRNDEAETETDGPSDAPQQP